MLSVALSPASHRVTLALLLLTLPLQTSCVNRAQIKAEIWLQSGLPADLCERVPELKKYGQYRELDTGKYEFLGYCTEVQDNTGKRYTVVQGYYSINGQKFDSIMDELLPKQ